MNILKIIRYTFSPDSYEEYDKDEYENTKEILKDEAIQNKLLYKMSEEENLKIGKSNQTRIDALADKHWNQFKNELNIPEKSNNSNLILYRLAAAFLFIVNPWLIYQSFDRAFTRQEALQDSTNTFFFSVEIAESWKTISIEFSLLMITFPFLVFLFACLLNRKKTITFAYYFLPSLSVFFSWGYYWLTNSDSILPIFTASLIAFSGILFFLINKKFRK